MIMYRNNVSHSIIRWVGVKDLIKDHLGKQKETAVDDYFALLIVQEIILSLILNLFGAQNLLTYVSRVERSVIHTSSLQILCSLHT